MPPCRALRPLLASGLAVFLVACGGGGGGGAAATLEIAGTIVNAAGQPVSGARIEDALATGSAVAGADGTFALQGATASRYRDQQRALLRVEAAGFVPQVVTVPVKAGVARYRIDPKLVPAKTVSVTPGVPTQIQDQAMGRVLTASFGARQEQGLRVVYAIIDPANGPGTLRDATAAAGQALQSGGMLYFQVVDASGTPIAPPADLRVDIVPFSMGAVPDAGPMQGYVLNDQGMWDAPQPAGDPAAGMQWSPQQFGFWNADRNFRTACVKGKVQVGSAACQGGRVTATGPDGISSFDSTGNDGSFCVTGAQTFPSQLRIGATTQTVQMPSNAGDCSAPSTCVELGTLTVAAAACAPAQCTPACPAGQTCVDGACQPAQCTPACPAGQGCLNGACVSLTNCAGRCCPGRDDTCDLPGAGCMCDDYCLQAGDCCPDFVASCQ